MSKLSRLRGVFDKWSDKIKGKKDLAIRPVLLWFQKSGFTPIGLSYLALMFGLIAVFALTINRNVYLVLIVISVLFDNLDGGLARLTNTTSEDGFWADFAFDRAIVLILMLVVYLQNSSYAVPYLLAPVMFIIETTIYVRVRKKIFNITLRTIYFVVVYFSSFYATVIALTVDLINVLVFTLYFSYKYYESSALGRGKE